MTKFSQSTENCILEAVEVYNCDKTQKIKPLLREYKINYQILYRRIQRIKSQTVNMPFNYLLNSV